MEGDRGGAAESGPDKWFKKAGLSVFKSKAHKTETHKDVFFFFPSVELRSP